MRTPWGTADFKRNIAEDGSVIMVATPGHGGVGVRVGSDYGNKLSTKARKEALRTSGWVWFEEDCDWAIVAYEFPELFPDIERDKVRQSLEDWNPDYLGIPHEEIVLGEDEGFLETAWGSWAEGVPEGRVGVGVGFTQERGGPGKIYGTIPREAYENSEQRGRAVIDRKTVISIKDLDRSWIPPGHTKQVA